MRVILELTDLAGLAESSLPVESQSSVEPGNAGDIMYEVMI